MNLPEPQGEADQHPCAIMCSREQHDFVLRARQWLPAPPQRVWDFVSDCRHMNHVIPRFMRFEVQGLAEDESPPRLGVGVTYDYRLRLHGLGFRWRTLVTEVDEPRRFVDIQAEGPYVRFSHEHTFEPMEVGTMTRDVLRYRPPGGPLARAVNAAYVRRDLRKLFVCRHRRLAELFADGGDPAARLFNLASPPRA